MWDAAADAGADVYSSDGHSSGDEDDFAKLRKEKNMTTERSLVESGASSVPSPPSDGALTSQGE